MIDLFFWWVINLCHRQLKSLQQVINRIFAFDSIAFCKKCLCMSSILQTISNSKILGQTCCLVKSHLIRNILMSLSQAIMMHRPLSNFRKKLIVVPLDWKSSFFLKYVKLIAESKLSTKASREQVATIWFPCFLPFLEIYQTGYPQPHVCIKQQIWYIWLYKL